MENFKKYLPFTIRGLISFLFIISAVAKLYPSPYFAITTFEVKQLYPLGFSESIAPYFSRILIGAEFALGLLLLQPHYLKKIVIPATLLMLVVFAAHLTITTLQTGGNSGNCGCFGTLLPMTPIEAIIKNVIAIALLVYLLKLLPKGTDSKNFWVLTTVTFATILMVFMIAPIQPPHTEVVDSAAPVFPDTGSALGQPMDTISTPAPATVTPVAGTPTDATPITTSAPVVSEPAPQRSAYAQYFPNADKGKKIIGLFAPGCEHCRATAKELTEMKAKDKNFPELAIIFMDEEADLIPDFFKFAGAQYPYKTLDVASFWKILGNANDTPGVIYLWNGNKIAEWNGINDKKFVGAELLKAIKKPYAKK